MSKLTNGYSKAISPRAYAETPKAVFAAIAVSFATCGGDNLADAEALVLAEWRVLHANGIVPQSPPAFFLAKYHEHYAQLCEFPTCDGCGGCTEDGGRREGGCVYCGNCAESRALDRDEEG